MKKYRWYFVAILFLVLMTGIFLGLRTKMRSQATASVKYGDLVEAIYGLGTVTANQSYQLKIGQMGMVHKIYVQEGEFVQKGSPLADIDQGNILTFRAPFAGTITSVPFKMAETVYPQNIIVSLVNLQDRYVVVSLEQEGALRVRKGQKAKMVVESLQGKVYSGTIRAVFPGENQFLVHIDFTNLPPEIIPGMTGDVAIEVANRTHVLLAPLNSLSAGNIQVRRDGSTKKIPVSIGAIDGRWAEILSGDLKEGDQVLLNEKEN